MRLHFDQLWHQQLKRPYTLVKRDDAGSRHDPVILLLHGIGRDASVWQPLVALLADAPCRVVSLDLLGFGLSPKPTWLDYTLDDHATAVIAAINRLRPHGPIIITGHSMGCLIAARVAYRRPDLVKHLVLYEMPLYEGLSSKLRYRWRVEAYIKLYEQIIKTQPLSQRRADKLTRQLVERVTGQTVSAASWQPYIKSLQHSIIEQTTSQDVAHINMPIDVIYGSRDTLVIRGEAQQIFGSGRTNITAHTIRERHAVTASAASFLRDRLVVALAADTTKHGHSRLRDLLRDY